MPRPMPVRRPAGRLASRRSRGRWRARRGSDGHQFGYGPARPATRRCRGAFGTARPPSG